jgi:ABC-type nitrate/sulfonate/bicarbonate transport system substrate-binding protein
LVFFAALLWGIKAGAAELRRITLGYSSIGPMATGFWMAKEFGAFEKQGIHAELIYISSGPPQKYLDETYLTRATAVR